MTASSAKKLRITKNAKLFVLHAPHNFLQQLQPLPAGVEVIKRPEKCSQIHWFVKSRAEVEADLNNVLAILKDGVVCWIYYPKGSSKIQTDLTRDKGWDLLMMHDELQWLSLISFNEIWSAFGIRLKTETDNKEKSQPRQRAVSQYVDSASKTIKLPEDIALALTDHLKQKEFFENLSFTNKKEFVEWIVSAKKEETRKQRLEQLINKLSKQYKNPSDKTNLQQIVERAEDGI